MIFYGISRIFSLVNEEQYYTIGTFWDEITEIHGLENLIGLGYEWSGNEIKYAIGLKKGIIDGYNLAIELSDCGCKTVHGNTDSLKEIYAEVYKSGALTYALEKFYNDGSCCIGYYR